jgi:anionic cell wall polymer biosynthesis LytR-Cps2A-Psr (LCP) family protein
MRKKSPAITFLFIILVCFVVGFLSALLRGVNREGSDQGTTVVEPNAVVEGSPTLQQSDLTSVLILGIDEIESENAALRAVWVATYGESGESITLNGFPVDAQIGSTSSAPLNDLFRWSQESGVSPLFLSVLQQVPSGEPEAVIVLDEAGFSEIIDFMGGVVLSGERLNGDAVLGVLRLLNDDPETSLSIQVHLLEAMVAQASYLEDTLELTPLLELVPKHAYTSQPTDHLFALLARLLPLRQQTIRVVSWDGTP